jgi:hypothetical protein
LDDDKVGFSLNATLVAAELSPVTVIMNQAALDIKLQRSLYNSTTEMAVVISSQLPKLVIGARQSHVPFTLNDSLTISNSEMLRTLFLDLNSKQVVRYDIQLSGPPRFQIPGLVGSWELSFYRQANVSINCEF